ncbi:hypothetical protein Tco_0816062 [Tanacetum coccineum]
MEEEQNQLEVIQDLLLKLMNDLQILKGIKQEKEKPAAQSFIPYWNFSMIDDEEARENFMKDICTFLRKFSRIPFGVTPKHLDTIPSVENLVPTLIEFKGISEDTCDVPVCEDPSTFDALNDHSEILSDPNDDGTSSDDDDFEDIDRLITNIESLKDNPTPDRVLKSPSSFPIPVTDSDSFFEKSGTSLSYSDNSLPEFEPFSDDTEETRSGSTTTHANNSLPEYDSFLFEIEPDQGELTNVVIEEVDTFLIPEDSIPLGIESNFDPGGGEIDVSQDVEDDNSFTSVIRTFLLFLTYPVDSPLLLSTGSEDTIFDPVIFT